MVKLKIGTLHVDLCFWIHVDLHVPVFCVKNVLALTLLPYYRSSFLMTKRALLIVAGRRAKCKSSRFG